MSSNLDRIKQDLERLLKQGLDLVADFQGQEKAPDTEGGKAQKQVTSGARFRREYNQWYSEALEVVTQTLPSRAGDFEVLYKRPKRKEIDHESYTISDYMIDLAVKVYGNSVNTYQAAGSKFVQQFLILEACKARFESALLDIQQLLQADLFDSELQSAEELLKKGFLRAAGIVAGVVAERHLKIVCAGHGLQLRKSRPTISDFNDELKDSGIIDIPVWRSIQRTSDLRNLCGHDKEREPTKDEVAELISSVDRIIKTIH